MYDGVFVNKHNSAFIFYRIFINLFACQQEDNRLYGRDNAAVLPCNEIDSDEGCVASKPLRIADCSVSSVTHCIVIVHQKSPRLVRRLTDVKTLPRRNRDQRTVTWIGPLTATTR
jgi:hypothetical protein